MALPFAPWARASKAANRVKVIKLLLLSTPVAPLGSGLGGGVELTVANLARVLVQFGHQLTIVTPEGAQLGSLGLLTLPIEIIQVSGTLQTAAQSTSRATGRNAPVTVSEVLASAWTYARCNQARYDLIVNFAYDWLPFYLTPFMTVPVAHFVSMGSLSDRMDAVIAQVSHQFPGTLAAYTQAQADTFCTEVPIDWKILGCGLDLRQYEYCPNPDNHVAWVGRLSPEKGLEDAIAAASRAHQSLKIYGAIEDEAYWRSLQPAIEKATAQVEYCGFLSTALLQRSLGKAKALLVTPHWVEAFGIVAIEALACGVPVLAYRQGGPAEIVRSGKTGWLVRPGNIAELTIALHKLNRLNRQDCRLQAEKLYSLNAWGRRCERWFYQLTGALEN
ncbi:MAG: glycosyltransferase [Cyanobacteria bacterium J06588_5]